MACARLHSFLIDCNISPAIQLTINVEEAEEKLRIWLIWIDVNDQEDYLGEGEDALRDVRRRSVLHSNVLNSLVKILHLHGVIIPPWACLRIEKNK